MTAHFIPALRPSIAIAFLALFLLSGCPLVSEHPLSDPQAARIDEALVGSWRTLALDEGEWKRLAFLPFDERELVAFAPGDEADSIDALRAFTTEIEGTRFLNVRELGTGRSPSGWYILRYAIDGDRLVMTIVDDALFEGKTFAGSADLGEFVRRNLSNPLLFSSNPGEKSQDTTLYRVKDEK